mgnify:CR=1 FL=1
MNTKPNLVVTELDAGRIEELLANMPKSADLIKKSLLSELDRADIVASKDIPRDVVTMNSTVRFQVLASKEHFEYTLVYPKDMNPEGGKISILAPIGSALLGLAEGDEIEWPTPDGVVRVRVDKVVYQPEDSGDFHL